MNSPIYCDNFVVLFSVRSWSLSRVTRLCLWASQLLPLLPLPLLVMLPRQVDLLINRLLIETFYCVNCPKNILAWLMPGSWGLPLYLCPNCAYYRFTNQITIDTVNIHPTWILVAAKIDIICKLAENLRTLYSIICRYETRYRLIYRYKFSESLHSSTLICTNSLEAMAMKTWPIRVGFSEHLS